LAAYAAALALVLPVEAQMTAVAPRSAALLTASVMPRSLNDPVGFAPSTFRYTSHRVRRDSTGAGTSGVAPSPSVITGVVPVTGSQSRYCRITPGQDALLTPFPGCTSFPGGADALTRRSPPPPASRW